MGIVVGIDIGGSITKIVGLENGLTKTPLTVRAADPVASLFGAFGKFIDANSLSLADVDKVMLTGVGASFINKPIYGISTGRVEEFLANGLGGLYLSGLKRAVIVSMGTGTALVKASSLGIEHIGGTGIGGGTILGLAGRMLNVRDIKLIIQLAESGNLSHVDLMVGDITKEELPGLPPDITASNFGNISDVATQGDIALGILNLVLQTIGTSSIFAVRNSDIKDIVLIGSLSSIPQCRIVFKQLMDMFDVRFIIPENSEFGTAVGAALAFTKSDHFEDI